MSHFGIEIDGEWVTRYSLVLRRNARFLSSEKEFFSGQSKQCPTKRKGLGFRDKKTQGTSLL